MKNDVKKQLGKIRSAGAAGAFVGVGCGIWALIIGIILILTGIGAIIGVPLLIAAIGFMIAGPLTQRASCPNCASDVYLNKLHKATTCKVCRKRLIRRKDPVNGDYLEVV